MGRRRVWAAGTIEGMERTTIPNLVGRTCWICDDDNVWEQYLIESAWLEAERDELDQDDDLPVWPTVYATNEAGESWVIQLPDDESIRIRDEPDEDWLVWLDEEETEVA